MQRLVLLVVALLLVPSLVHAQAGESQAERQLGFARAELEAGRHDRAIKSCESALRFDPTAFEAIVIKALSFEALGDPGKAEELFDAYDDFIRGGDADPRVAAARTRLANVKRKKGKTPEPPTPATIGADTKKRIGLGRCDEAFAPARDVVASHPKAPAGWEALGDVHRCVGLTRQAGLDFSQAVALGGADSGLKAKLEAVRAELGSFVLELDTPSTQGLEITVAFGDGVLEPEWRTKEARFELMPPGVDYEVALTGRGFGDSTVTVPALAPGEARRIPVTPDYKGLGTVRIADWPAGVIEQVEVVDGDATTKVFPDQTLTLEAGAATAKVSSTMGTIEAPFTVVRDQEVVFEPGKWIPSALVVSGVPAGSKVEVQVATGEDTWLALGIPSGTGTLNQASGAFLAPARSIRGLLAGPTTLRVTHPTLGVGAQAVTLEPAVENEVLFDLSVLPGTAELTKEWKAHKAVVNRPHFKGPALITLIGGGASLVLGGIMAGVSGGSKAQEIAKYNEYRAVLDAGQDADALLDEWHAQGRTTQGTGIASGIFFGLGGVAVGASFPIAIFLKPKAVRDAQPKWAPDGF